MAGSSGVAGQVVIDVVARDKVNIKDLGNGLGDQGKNAGSLFGKNFSSSAQKFIDDLKGILNDATYTFRDPFIGLRSMAARNGQLAAQEFARAFNLASKTAINRFSYSPDNLNRNMTQHLPYGRLNSKSGTPYYLMTKNQQFMERINPYNFWENYGTGKDFLQFAKIQNLGREARAMFRQGMDSANWYNVKKGMTLTEALRHNLTANGREENPFAYYSGKPARFLSEKFNQLLVKPNLLGSMTASGTGKLADYTKRWENSTSSIARGANSLAQSMNNVLPGVVNAGVNLTGAALPVVIQAASSGFLIALSQSMVGFMGAGWLAKSALQEYGDFEQSALRFKTLQFGITDKDFKSVTDTVKQTAADLPLITAGELMKAVEAGQRGGVLSNYKESRDITPMNDFVKFIGTAASAFKNQGYNPEALTNDIIRVGSVFDINDPKYYKEMLNKLLYATTLSTSDMKDMVDFLKLQGTQFRTGGMTFEEALAEYVSQVQEFGSTGSILASLNRSMDRGIDNRQNVLTQLGVNTFDERGVTRDKAAIVTDLRNALLKLDPSLSPGQLAKFSAAFFNSYGSRGGILSHPEYYQKNLDLITTVDPQLMDKYANVADTGVYGIVGRIKSMWSEIMIDIGETLAPDFDKAGRVFIDAFKEFGDKLKETLKDYAGIINEEVTKDTLKDTFNSISNFITNVLDTGKDLVPVAKDLVFNLPKITEKMSELSKAVADFSMDDDVIEFIRSFSDEWSLAYSKAKMQLPGGNSSEIRELAQKIYHGEAKTDQDWLTEKKGGVLSHKGFFGNIGDFFQNTFVNEDSWTHKNGQQYNFLWTLPNFIGSKIKKVYDAKQRELNAISEPANAAMLNLRAMKLGLDERFYQELDKAPVPWDELPDPKAEAERAERLEKEKEEARKFIKTPYGNAPRNFDPFAEFPGNKRDLVKWVPKKLEEAAHRYDGLTFNPGIDLLDDLQNFIGENFDPWRGIREWKPLTNEYREIERKAYEDLHKYDKVKVKTEDISLPYEIPKVFTKEGGINAEGFSDLNRMLFGSKKDNFYKEQVYRSLLQDMFKANKLEIPKEHIVNGVLARDFSWAWDKDKDGVPAVENISKDRAIRIGKMFARGYSLDEKYNPQDIADDYGMDSLEFNMFQRGQARRNRVNVEAAREEEKAAKEKSKKQKKENEADLEKLKIQRAENQAQRRFQTELDKRNKAMEKWRTETQNEFDFRVNEAQQYHAQEVSGALGSLKGVIGNNWGYLSNAEVQNAMEYYDPTKATKIGDVVENLQRYGTADPRKVAYMKSVQNMQDIANGKAFQEQMWYEYIDAVTQGGTTNEFTIDNGAIVFNIPKLDSIQIKDSTVSVMAEKVEAFLDDEVKDDIKAIREYCDEQGAPISV